MNLVLGIDLGSSWSKAALYDSKGRVVASHKVPSHLGPHGPGASQEDLDAWWRGFVEAARPLAALGPVDGIGFSVRGYWGVYLDQNWRAIAVKGPEVLPRGEAYSAEGWGEGGPWARAYSPLLASTGKWLREEHPDLHRRVRRIGALHDYLLWRLTGRWLTDPCNGPAGLAEWPPAVMQVTGFPREAFPEMLPAEAPAGGLLPAAAREMGLPEGTTVAVSIHDGAAANLGGSAHRVGDAMVTLGTNTVLRVVMGHHLEGAFGYPIPPGRYAWVRGIVGTAHRVQDARQNGDAAYRAALREVADVAGELLDGARKDGLNPTRFVLTGGLSNVPYMRRQLKQRLGGVIRRADPEAGMRGAAMLASVACGWFPDADVAERHMRYRPLRKPRSISAQKEE